MRFTGRIPETEMMRITVQKDGTLWRVHLAATVADAWFAGTKTLVFHTALRQTG
jgi:hypothetical protein